MEETAKKESRKSKMLKDTEFMRKDEFVSHMVRRGRVSKKRAGIYYDLFLKVLKEEKFYWLIDSELDSAIIEIKNHTLIWHEGIYKFGNWKYGIFKKGGFYGSKNSINSFRCI